MEGGGQGYLLRGVPSSRAAGQPSSRASSRAAGAAGATQRAASTIGGGGAMAAWWRTGAAMHRQLGEEPGCANSLNRGGRTRNRVWGTCTGGEGGAELTSRWSAPWCYRPGRRRRRGEPPRSPANRGREEAQVSCDHEKQERRSSDIFTTVLLCTQKRGSLGLIMIGVTNIEAY